MVGYVTLPRGIRAVLRPLLAVAAAWPVSGVGSLHGQAPQDGGVRRVLIIGGSPIDPETRWFEGTVGLQALPGGRIAVSSRKSYNVRIFDDKGRLLRSMGRKGEGPGELSSPGAPRLVGDRIAVSANLGRIAWFDTLGKHIKTTSADLDSLRNPVWVLRHQWVLTQRTPPVPKTVRMPVHQLDVHYLLRRGRARADTIASVMPGLHVELRNGIVGSFNSTFPQSGDVAVIGDSVIVVADGIAGTVRWIRVDRDSARVLRQETLPFPRRPVTASEVSAAVRAMAESGQTIATDGARGSAGRPPLRPINPPKAWSVARRVLASEDGHVWVRTVDAPGGAWGWMVFPPSGPPLRIELPRRFTAYDVEGTRIYGTEPQGDDAIMALVVYELRR